MIKVKFLYSSVLQHSKCIVHNSVTIQQTYRPAQADEHQSYTVS